MFSKDELQSIDRRYFKVMQAGAFCIVLESRNTGHQWWIGPIGFGDEIQLHHRHKRSYPWHLQKLFGKRHTLPGAIDEIKCHDRYVLNGRKRERNLHRRVR